MSKCLLHISTIINKMLYACSALRKKPPAKRYKKVCIYKNDRMGDLIIATTAIKSIVEHYGLNNIVLVGSNCSKILVQKLFPGLEILEVSFGHCRLWNTKIELFKNRKHGLFTRGVDVLISLRHQRSMHDDLIIGAIPAASTIGINRFNSPISGIGNANSGMVFDVEPPGLDKEHYESHELTRHRSIVKCLGIKEIAFTDIESLARIKTTRPFIGISLTGSNPIRDLTIAQLESVGRIAYNHNLDVIAFVTKETESRVSLLVNKVIKMQECPIRVILTEDTDELLAYVKEAVAIVSVESFIAHLCILLDRPFLGIIGGGHYGEFAPWQKSDKQVWITNRMECYYCSWKCKFTSPLCLTEIDNHMLENSLKQVLHYASQ